MESKVYQDARFEGWTNFLVSIFQNGLTPLHLCAQGDKVKVAAILVKNGAQIDSKTKVDQILILNQIKLKIDVKDHFFVDL